MIAAHGSIQDAVQAMKLGAVDCLEKPFSTETLTKVVCETLKGHKDTVLMVRRRLATLRPRERELLDAIVLGRTTRMVADRLGISPRTADKHRLTLMKKMRATNVADLVRMVIQAGF
jgi:two-component system response regulator FixJ